MLKVIMRSSLLALVLLASPLAAQQERAALVGATVQIESAPGEGTTIFVRTPTMPVPAVPLSPDGVGV